MNDMIRLIANYLPIVIGIGWLLLMNQQKHEGATNTATILVFGITAMSVLGKSIGAISQNLPLLIALLILAYVNLWLYPKLTEAQQADFSRGNMVVSLGLLGYQALFQYGFIWQPYLANESGLMTVLVPIYIVVAILFFLITLGLFLRGKFFKSEPT